MTEASFHRGLLVVWGGLALVSFAALLRRPAPYGRHSRAGLGPTLSRTLGWMAMEAPSALGMLLLVALAPRPLGAAAWALVTLWELHYLNRAFVFPLRMRGGQSRMPLAIAASAFAFNGVNVYLNGRWLTALGPRYDAAWVADPRFLVGVALFWIGWAVNLRADAILRELRRDGDGYRIPRGGLYESISCPNYFGELVEWTGWALATWSLAGALFALWTAANLLPRARAHHQWYRRQFPDYPRERRAILPFFF